MGREYCTMRLGRHEQKVELCLERRIRKNGYAGFVSSKCFREDVLIVVNDGFLEDQGIRVGYITAREDGTHPMVIMTSTAFTELKQGHLSVRFFLMHELGHYYHGHLVQPPKLEDVFSDREASMNKGIVPKEELEADSFAAQYLGAENAIEALQEAMEERMAYDLMCGASADQISKLALREYQLRIDAVCSDSANI